MPLYTFECESCGHQFDDSRSVDDHTPGSCQCGGKAVRLISVPSSVISRGGDGEHETKGVVDLKAAIAKDLFGRTTNTKAKMRAYAEQLNEAKQSAATAKREGGKRPWKHAARIPGETFFHARHEMGADATGASGLEHWRNKGFGVEQ